MKISQLMQVLANTLLIKGDVEVTLLNTEFNTNDSIAFAVYSKHGLSLQDGVNTPEDNEEIIWADTE